MMEIVEILVLGGYVLAFLIAFMFFSLKHERQLKSKLNGATIQISKLQSKLNKSNTKADKSNTTNIDVTNMSLDDVAEMLGIDEKELNNPLIRPLIEKMFDRFKQGQLQNVETDNSGY